MEEEGAIIAGLLVGLNVIDANFCMKGEDLDSQVRVCSWGGGDVVSCCPQTCQALNVSAHSSVPGWSY